MDTEYCFVYVTAPDDAVASRIAQRIVEQRFAACANILPGMRSVYWWEGKLETADEVVVIFKTRWTLAQHLTEAVVAEHPYECPCIVVLPIQDGNPAFLHWIGEETGARD